MFGRERFPFKRVVVRAVQVQPCMFYIHGWQLRTINLPRRHFLNAFAFQFLIT